MTDTDFPYEDIVGLPHHQSEQRPHMTMIDRAAQFSPFQALTGYSDAIDETARLTDEKVQLDEGRKEEINRMLQELLTRAPENRTASITYFMADEKKDGGSYRTVTGNIWKLKEFEKLLIMENGEEIPVEDIYSLW